MRITPLIVHTKGVEHLHNLRIAHGVSAAIYQLFHTLTYALEGRLQTQRGGRYRRRRTT